MDHDDDCAYCASGEAYEHTYEPPATNMADLTDPSTLLNVIAERFAEDADAYDDTTLLAELFAAVVNRRTFHVAGVDSYDAALAAIDRGDHLPD